MEKLFDRVKAIERDLDPKGMGTVFNVLGDVSRPTSSSACCATCTPAT